MKKAFFKDSKKIFLNNLGRFISIVLIILLGTAFFVGMNAVSPLMEQTAKDYMKKNNIYDFELVSNLGYKEEDINKLKENENIEEIQGIYTYDALASFGEKDIVVRLISENNEGDINNNYLVEGREIEEENECLISSRLKDMYEYEIGDTISFYRKDDTKIEKSISTTEFKIVGIAKNPKYLSKFYGSSSLSTGEVHSYIIVKESVFELEDYTAVYIKAKIDEDIDRFSDEYIEKNDEIIDEIDKVNEKISQKKYSKIYKDNFKLIEENEEKVKDIEKLVKEKYSEIRKSQISINESIVQVALSVSQYYNTPSIYNKINQKQKEIQNLYDELEQLENEKEDLEDLHSETDPKIKSLKTELETIENDIEKNLYEIYSLEDEASQFVNLSEKNYKLSHEYYEKNKEYEEYNKEYEENTLKLEETKDSINDKKEEINNSQQELYISFQGLEALIDGMKNKELSSAVKTINAGKKQIEEGYTSLVEQNIEERIEKSKDTLAKKRNELSQFKAICNTTPLYKNSGFKSLKDDLKKIAIMGKIFPVMFFVIAILVTITTITRMIEEDRKNIGTFKALGYGNSIITRRYLIYALCAGLLGGILGTIIGSFVIVNILFVSYSAMYDLPDLVSNINIGYIILALAISLISTLLFAWIVTKKSLKENAAQLVRPKLETSGKNIFLEKIPFIWNKLDFLFKICFRNIFRYKKRLLMTLIGIAGCTALIYAGLGLQNAVNSIGNVQFKDIRKMSLEVYLKDEYSLEDVKEIQEYIEEQKYIEEVMPIRQQSLKVEAKDNGEDIFYMVLEGENADKYISMQERKSKDKIDLNDDGVVMTEKLANILDVKKGDKIDIIDDDIKSTVKVIGITENYLYNYIYFTPKVYERIYGKEMMYNEIFVNTDDKISEEDEIELSDKLKENENIASTVWEKNLEKEFKTSLASLMSIVILFLACASLLSFTVLINLNNINIEERKREISTIKLLGFYKKEIESYVFRENIILTIMGTLIGLILGMSILGVIIQAAEVETIFLAKEINYLNLFISIATTIIFTLITNFIMKRKLKNIDMIDSLKSIE